MLESVTIKIDKTIRDAIRASYASFECENNGEYIDFFAKNKDVAVTIFKSNKENQFKAYFLGKNALNEARKFDKNANLNEKKKTSDPGKASWIVLDDQIGSDEVGCGDFFGPICVCAAYVKKSDIKRLKELGVDDSKRLTDDEIRTIGHILINEFDYSQVSLNNEKYNELQEKGIKMNEMKCKLHNKVLLNLKKKHPEVKNILLDQFEQEKTYYSHLFGEKEIVEGITFHTKGESYYPSVAVGSIIARFSFLQKMDALSEKYGVTIPFGASLTVDEFAKKFKAKFGQKELDKIVKKNFSNYNKVNE